jgi:hypothetical protein
LAACGGVGGGEPTDRGLARAAWCSTGAPASAAAALARVHPAQGGGGDALSPFLPFLHGMAAMTASVGAYLVTR